MTVQNSYLNPAIDSRFNQSPSRYVAPNTIVEQVVVVLSGNKKDEQILPHALKYAREKSAELVVVHAYRTEGHSQPHAAAELHIKSIYSKLKAQYENVIAFLHDGTSKLAVLKYVIDEQKQTCVMMHNTKLTWLQRLWKEDVPSVVVNKHSNVFVELVAV